MSHNPSEDSRLVRSALGGDRRSFEQIVHRYQTLICSITYSGTGDLALSEDLAQETFVVAWRTLGRLREPGSLRAWLCGIARRTAAGARRAMARAAAPLPLADDVPLQDSLDPAERMIRQEDRDLMWNTLGQLPAIYREPLVLFYREGQSVRRVAEDLGLTVDAVKQRLSRGRRLLTGRVAALVQRALTDSTPGKAFTVGVIAALPPLLPQAASAGVIAAGTKGTVLGKAALLSGTVGALLGPVLGLLGALIGVLAGVRAARSPAERRFVIRVGWLTFAYIGVFGNLFIAAAYLLLHTVPMTVTLTVLAILSLLYVAGVAWLAVWANRRQRQIRIRDGTETTPEAEWTGLSPRNITWSLAGATLGSICWIFGMAVGTGDWPTALAVVAIACGLLLPSLRVARQGPRSYCRVSIALTAGLGLLNLAVVNLRWPHWVGFVTAEGARTTASMPPLWALNLLLIGIFTMVLTAVVMKDRQLRRSI